MCRKYNYPCFGNVACSSHYECNMIWNEMAFLYFICTGTSRQVECVCMVLVIHHSW